MNKNIQVLFLTTLILLTSCKTKEKASELNYMQNMEQVAVDIARNNVPSTIQKGDKISIYITAKDLAVVRPFNQNYSVVESSLSSTPSSNTPTSQLSEKSSAPIYIVDSEGEIDFPVLGKLDTKNKTLVEFQNDIRTRVSEYVKNPTVNIRVTNFKFSVLGEVNKPGEYSVSDGTPTILTALGLAGDVTMYAKRNDILIVRNIDGRMESARINLMDASFVNSPYYQIKQNDVIYVSSNQTKEKIARQNPSTSIYIAVAGMIIGLAGIFITIFK